MRTKRLVLGVKGLGRRVDTTIPLNAGRLTTVRNPNRLTPRRARARIVAAFLLAASLIVGGSIAWASIPGSNNLVTACVTSATGNVRIIDTDTGQTCTAAETKVSWGGGMRFRGIWTYTGGANPGNIPYTSADPVRKGDVIRYEGPSNLFGCTSPKGAWVNVAGAHSYPCLEFPKNWAPLALDGKDGKAAPVSWVRFNASGAVLAKSTGFNVTPYAYSDGTLWLNVPDLNDDKCAVTVTPLSDTLGVSITRSNESYPTWTLLRATKNGTAVASGAEVVFTC